jgi:hypothetical protein
MPFSITVIFGFLIMTIGGVMLLVKINKKMGLFLIVFGAVVCIASLAVIKVAVQSM